MSSKATARRRLRFGRGFRSLRAAAGWGRSRSVQGALGSTPVRRVAEMFCGVSAPGLATKSRIRAAFGWLGNLVLAEAVFRIVLPGHASLAFLYGTLFVQFYLVEAGKRSSVSGRRQQALPALRASLWSALVVEAATLLAGASHASLLLLIAAAAACHLGLGIGVRVVLAPVLRGAAQGDSGARRVAIVGTGPMARALAAALRSHPSYGRLVEGFIDDDPADGVRTLGKARDLERLAQTHFLDEILVCMPDEPVAARRAVFAARRLRVEIRVVPEVYGCALSDAAIEMVRDIPLLTLQKLGDSEVRSAAKRLLDVVLASAALLLMAPALGLIGLLVMLDSPGPAFYCAPRVGRRGRHFLCFKFRTMQCDAEERKPMLRLVNERAGPFFKLRNDPRVTRVGGFLRRYSLDELPQLWNVLRGEMSLVGPRPHPLDDLAHYTPEHLQRLAVTPGLTGLWQVTARNDPSFERNLMLDREYIEKQSLWMDLWILCRTVREVALGSGV